jgi:glucose-1-phosphate adenylyltransferase
VGLELGDQFGIIQIDSQRRVSSFREKPSDPDPIPGDPTRCLASMGIYVFNANFLFEQLCQDATSTDSAHDFGKDILPAIIDSHLVRAHLFRDPETGEGRYWRDVGTLDAYYEANMDLVGVKPQLNLYEDTWPIRTYQPPYPPPKFVFAQLDGDPPRVGQALDSMVCNGSIISGGRVQRSIISHNVRINSWADVQDSILFEGVEIGRNARIRRAIIDKRVRIPRGMEVGYDLGQDRARGFTVTESGIVVIGKIDGVGELEQHPEPRSRQSQTV